MKEILPGVWHWTARHPKIHIRVSSYWLEEPAVAIDPLLPDEGLDWFRRDGRTVRQIVLTNRHHSRDAEQLAETFDARVLAHGAGLHEFTGSSLRVQPFAPGDTLAPGVTAHELAAICPDDAVLHIAAGPGALAFADGIITRDGEIGFVPDDLMDGADEVKRLTMQRLRPMLELPFDALLFAHGDPIVTGGKEALRRFVERP
jgi:hypothetical protein